MSGIIMYISMYQTNKECSNIDLKLRKKKNNKMRKRKKVSFINFFV